MLLFWFHLCSNALYGYITSLGTKLLQRVQLASTWIESGSISALLPSHDIEDGYIDHMSKTLEHFMMGIQKVMQSMEQNRVKEGDGEFCLLLATINCLWLV